MESVKSEVDNSSTESVTEEPSPVEASAASVVAEQGMPDKSVSEPAPSPTKQQVERTVAPPVAKQPSFPTKFQLAPDLSNGQISLVRNEAVVESWVFESTSMSIAEWFATLLSCGMYYFMTRIVLQRRRYYKVYVTNMNIIVKEEMTETSWGCLKLLLENQASFPISSLAFVTAEVIGQKLCGCLPASVVLEMRFGRYPVDSEYPTTVYRSLLAIIFSPFANASKAAYKNVFGIDFDAPPVKLSVQLVKAIPLLSVPHMWILWGAAFAFDLVQQACHAAYLMMIAALLDPSVGPRQATGAKDACVFRLEADVSEDPECQHKMRKILDAITRLLPDKGIIDTSTVKPRLGWPMQVVPAGSAPKHINSKKKYGEENGFVILEDYLSIPGDETVYDACPVNPHWTFSDVKKVIMSLGAYYITDMAGYIQHRTNMIFTNKRIIQHSVLVSSFGGACDHSRLDFWVNDDFVNMTAAEFKKRTTFRATAKNLGWLSFEIKKTSPFTMFVFRSLFRPLYRAAPGTPGLCSMTKEQWQSHNLFRGSILTSCALANSNTSIIDVAAHSDQEMFSCLYSWFCCPKSPKTTITATDEALYIEDYREATCCKSAARVFVALPWSEVDGVYWQNFDAAGPNCMMAYILSCVCPGLFGYYGCVCCCCSPNGAKENNTNFFDYIFGYKGSTVAVCARGDNTFCLGMVIPGQFYGVHYNAQVNALVDSINFRCLLNDPKNAFIDTSRGPASGAVMQVNGGGAGAAVTAATGQIANMAQLSQVILSGRVDGSTAFRQTSATLFSHAPNMNLNMNRNNQQGARPTATIPVAVAVPVNNPIAAGDRGYYANSVDNATGANCPHWSMYQGHNCRPKPPTTGFPLQYDMSTGYVSLAAGEELVRGWKVETTHMEIWELVLAIMTFGMSFLYHKLFIQRRRFYNIYITTDRVLVKEEVFEMRMWTVCRIMENQASFKLSDMCYISSQELGPQYCGCIPALTEITLRFGRYPYASEVANSIDTLKASSSDRNPWTVAVAEAAASAYGIYESGTPEAVMNNVIKAEQNPKGFLTEMLDAMHFSFVITRSLCLQATRFLIKAIISFFFSKMSTVGPAQVTGSVDSRSFSILFKTRNAATLANDVVKTLTQAAACKHTPLVPSVKLNPIASPRFVKCETGQLAAVNNTNKYGAEGGFVILQRMWDLLQGEVVYDVVPTNPRWSLMDRIMTILTAGIYWLLYVRRKLQYKTSHMVTDRRLITHTLRITWGTVRYSSLEMWLLAPVTSFTVAKKSVPCTNLLCRTRTTFEFITDSTKFGVLRIDLRCEPFILNMLKVMTQSQEHRRLRNVVSMSKAEVAAIPEMGAADYTTEFLAGEDVVDVAIGSTLPRTCWQFLRCKKPMKFAITFTGNSIYVEAYDDRRRLFTSLSWELVTGTYWSNFQAHSNVCIWHNSTGFITPLHGFSGSQVRICVNAGRSFGIGIILPSRFYQALVADDHVNSFVTALSHRLVLAQSPHLIRSSEYAVRGDDKI